MRPICIQPNRERTDETSAPLLLPQSSQEQNQAQDPQRGRQGLLRPHQAPLGENRHHLSRLRPIRLGIVTARRKQAERSKQETLKRNQGVKPETPQVKDLDEETTLSPRRWGTNARAWAYRYLVLRDGEHCAICHARPTTQNTPTTPDSTTQNSSTTQNTLDIDHIDGDPNNNHPDNLRLLCRQCNVATSNTSNPRKRH